MQRHPPPATTAPPPPLNRFPSPHHPRVPDPPEPDHVPPAFAGLVAALAFAAIAPASAQTPASAADLAGRWTSDTRDERGMEIRTEGARIAAVRLWRTDGTVCTQTLSGTFDPAR